MIDDRITVIRGVVGPLVQKEVFCTYSKYFHLSKKYFFGYILMIYGNKLLRNLLFRI
jgi:hypothetical protein